MGCSFKALSDERRRTILAILGEHDASAGEIASRFSISQPTVSNHLKILKEAGLITEQKIRQNRIYSLHKPGIYSVIETLKSIVKEA
jgi:DNA-binding transcriptional ArsR family regulator